LFQEVLITLILAQYAFFKKQPCLGNCRSTFGMMNGCCR